MLAYIIIVGAAYFLGSIPTGYLVARAKGIDIRAVGSGNIGATNAMRVLGKPAGIIVLLADALKGYAAVAWLCPLLMNLFNGPAARVETLRIVAGIAAVLGHNYTCWLKFKGGKGIATSAGVYFALAPLAAGIALGAWIGRQPPSATATAPPPSQGAAVLALRPACASWMHIFAVPMWWQ